MEIEINNKTYNIEEEFSNLMNRVADCNGINDLLMFLDDLVPQETKKDFIINWHEQDDDDRDY